MLVPLAYLSLKSKGMTSQNTVRAEAEGHIAARYISPAAQAMLQWSPSGSEDPLQIAKSVLGRDLTISLLVDVATKTLRYNAHLITLLTYSTYNGRFHFRNLRLLDEFYHINRGET